MADMSVSVGFLDGGFTLPRLTALIAVKIAAGALSTN